MDELHRSSGELVGMLGGSAGPEVPTCSRFVLAVGRLRVALAVLVRLWGCMCKYLSA